MPVASAEGYNKFGYCEQASSVTVNKLVYDLVWDVIICSKLSVPILRMLNVYSSITGPHTCI